MPYSGFTGMVPASGDDGYAPALAHFAHAPQGEAGALTAGLDLGGRRRGYREEKPTRCLRVEEDLPHLFGHIARNLHLAIQVMAVWGRAPRSAPAICRFHVAPGHLA